MKKVIPGISQNSKRGEIQKYTGKLKIDSIYNDR